MVSAPANKMTAIPNAMRQIILITLLIFLKVYNRPTCKNNKNIEYISVGCSSILYAHKSYLELFSSTAGCFLWASCRRELFEGVASVSGSFWYDGFTEWMAYHPSTANRFYFSLGEKEKDGKNPRLAAVQEETDKVIAMLKAAGKEVFFEYNEGNHFGPLIERIEKAITNILSPYA